MDKLIFNASQGAVIKLKNKNKQKKNLDLKVLTCKIILEGEFFRTKNKTT